MFDRGADSLVCPTRQWAAKVSGEDSVRYLVGEHAIEDPLLTANHFHLKVSSWDWVVGGYSLSGEMRTGNNLNRARVRPSGQWCSQPVHRQLFAVALGLFGNLAGESGRCGFDNKIPSAKTRRIEGNAHHRNE